jgi:hypothetical protein
VFRKGWFAIGLLVVLLSASPVHASQQGPEHTAPYWQVTYWNNMTLSGDPVAQDRHERIDFAWGDRAPHSGVRSDRFSARWMRYVDVEAGTYRFTATSDDGIRVYVDGALIIDEWHDHPARTFVADLGLAAGHHLVTVEYYENTGHAVAKVSWEQVPPGSRSWHGEYFANRWLRGAPAMVRNDTDIDFAWGAGSPGAAIPSDGFSVRWTRTVDFQPGAYRFTATSDDGIRLSVDGRPVIDQWWDHPPRTGTGYLRLTAGEHLVTVEYYENTGHALAKVWWEAVPPQGWYGQYFDNRWLEKPPVLTRDDAVIDFNWGYGSPAPGIPSDGFSVRWMRAVSFREGQYRFTVSTDDGVRLWVNGHLLIDQWHDQSLRSHSGTIHLVGAAPIVMEYYENGGVAAAQLTWERVDENPPPPSPGDVIVDDADPGFMKGGAASAWRTAREGYGGGLVWTWNNDRVRSNYNWGRWVPNLTPGRYEVFAYIPDRYTTTARARYWISHRHGYTLRVVDQSANGGQWVSLGTYFFGGDRADYVSLADVTFEPYLSRMIAFDAVKWVPRSS